MNHDNKNGFFPKKKDIQCNINLILAINTIYFMLLTFIMYAIGISYHIRDENRAFSHNFYSKTERKTFLPKASMEYEKPTGKCSGVAREIAGERGRESS